MTASSALKPSAAFVVRDADDVGRRVRMRREVDGRLIGEIRMDVDGWDADGDDCSR